MERPVGVSFVTDQPSFCSNCPGCTVFIQLCSVNIQFASLCDFEKLFLCFELEEWWFEVILAYFGFCHFGSIHQVAPPFNILKLFRFHFSLKITEEIYY